MKKVCIRHMISSVVLLTGVAANTACTSDEAVADDPTPVTTQSLTVYYPRYDDESSADAKTRVGFDKAGNGYWQEGDVIGVWSEEEGKFKPFTVKDGSGTGKATFTGTMKGEIENYAVVLYPYSERHDLSYTNSSVTCHFPNTYTYTSVDKDYYSTDSSGNVVANINSFNMPMYGNVTDSKNSDGDRIVTFHNFGGVAVIKVDKIPESGTVTVTADQPVCGDACMTEEDKKFSYTGSDDGCKTVTFNYCGAEKLQQGVFCLPLLAGTYTLTVSIEGSNTTSDGTGKIDYKYSKTFDSFTLERSHLKRLEVTSNYEIYVNGHRFIDLGLSSGLLWAEVNLGATVPADFGNYYAWGYTEPWSGEYKPSWETYTKFGNYAYVIKTDCGLAKYNFTDGKLELDPEDDAATAAWGAPCRMPTLEECEAIMYYYNGETTNQWYRLPNSKTIYVDGVDIKSKTNGNTVFIPTSGYYDYTGECKKVYTEVYLQTSTRPLSSDYVYYANTAEVFESNGKPQFTNSPAFPRYYCIPVRAVVQP